MLNKDDVTIDGLHPDLLKVLMARVEKCMEKKGMDGPETNETMAASIECANNDKDNTDCCKKAGFTEYAFNSAKSMLNSAWPRSNKVGFSLI